MPLNPLGIKAVIFDMDGVLLDTEQLYKRASQAAAASLGFTWSDEVHNATIGIPSDASDQVIRRLMGESFPAPEFEKLWRDNFDREIAVNVPVKRGALALLQWLDANNVPAGLATSSSRKNAEHHLTEVGFLPLLKATVTRDDITNGKPHPEPFLTAAARLGVAPEHCLAFEDSYNGIRSAHGAGMKAVMVPDMLPPIPEIEALCHAVIDSLETAHQLFASV